MEPPFVRAGSVKLLATSESADVSVIEVLPPSLRLLSIQQLLSASLAIS